MTGVKYIRVNDQLLSDPGLEIWLNDSFAQFEIELTKRGYIFIYTSHTEGPRLFENDFGKPYQAFFRHYFFDPIEPKESDD